MLIGDVCNVNLRTYQASSITKGRNEGAERRKERKEGRKRMKDQSVDATKVSHKLFYEFDFA